MYSRRPEKNILINSSPNKKKSPRREVEIDRGVYVVKGAAPKAGTNSMGMAAAANVAQEILEVGGKDLCRVHVRPSGFPVEAEAVEVDKQGQHQKKAVFYGRFGNGTRAIVDAEERERYRAQIWGLRG